MVKKIIDESSKVKILSYILEENTNTFDRNLITLEIKEFIGGRKTEKVGYFEDNKQIRATIIFDEDY